MASMTQPDQRHIRDWAARNTNQPRRSPLADQMLHRKAAR